MSEKTKKALLELAKSIGIAILVFLSSLLTGADVSTSANLSMVSQGVALLSSLA